MNKKYYLSGIDWVINALNYSSQKKTGCGNFSQLVLEFDSKINSKDFELKLASFLKKFPVLEGKVARDLNLAPFWKIGSRKKDYILPLASIDLADDSSLLETVTKGFEYLNSHRNSYIYFLLIQAKTKTYLVFTFDHRLFDAYGAEKFLLLFQKYLSGEIINTLGFKPQGPFLERWKEKFQSGQRINRVFLDLAKDNAVKVFKMPTNLDYKNFRFEVISFDNQQSQRILEKANDQAGYLMTMPYLLAITLQSMRKIFDQKDSKDSNFVIPVSMDTRGKNNIEEKIFFNHLAFIMLKINDKEIKDTKILLDTIKKQFYAQVKENVARNMQEASMLVRIMPLSLVGAFLGAHSKGKNATFGFSFVGEGGFKACKFMQANINNFFHMPIVPVPPGFGIFFNQFNGKINLTLSYVKDIFTEKEVEQLIADIRGNFLA